MRNVEDTMLYARVDVYLLRFMERNGNERGPNYRENARIIHIKYVSVGCSCLISEYALR